MNSVGTSVRVAFALAIAGVSAMAEAQNKPNFSGVWEGTFVSQSGASSAAPVRSPAMADSPVTISQDGSAITIEYVSRGRSHSHVLLTYKFDGSEIRNATFSTTLQNVASSAAWESGSVVITTTAEEPDRTAGSPTGLVKYIFHDRLTLESPRTFRLDTSRSVNGTETTRVARFHRTDAVPGRAVP